MSSLISGLQTALQAVLSHQQAIQVIEHNVANANTPGYHRQEAVLTAGVPTGFSNMSGFSAGEMGSGVTVDRIKRYGLDFLDTRYRGQVSDAKRWALESQGLNQIEATLDETGENGLVAKMDAFYAGWQNLSVDPTNTTLRADVLQRSKDLAGAIQTRNTQLTQTRIDQNLEIGQRGDEINQIAGQVASLNVEIAHIVGTNQQPNDLMDQRDQILDRLSELTGARYDAQASGMMTVSIAGFGRGCVRRAWCCRSTRISCASSGRSGGRGAKPRGGPWRNRSRNVCGGWIRMTPRDSISRARSFLARGGKHLIVLWRSL